MPEENKIVEKNTQIRLLLYFIVSAVGYLALVLPRSAGVSVPVFAVLQLIMLWFIVPERRRLWFFVPIVLLSLNFFISDSTIWRGWNIVVHIVLYAAMFTNLNFRSKGCGFISNILRRVFAPFRFFHLPLSWAVSLNEGKAPLIRRVLLALAVSLPCAAVLIAVLSSADMVFSQGTANLLDAVLSRLNLAFVFKCLLAMLAGLYLFGMLCSHFIDSDYSANMTDEKRGDPLIIGIFLGFLLAIYTVFVVIQFRYLFFAGGELPYGLSYTDYARRGFFELLGLSGVNIAIILFTVGRNCGSSLGTKILKWLSCYLCLVTMVLLVSSFWRMKLYCTSDGLTRLRFFVLGFLIFEALGLVITLFYIFRPTFNIVMVYLAIGLCYYVLLNLVPVDAVVARSQVDMYLSGQRRDVYYALSLSGDAAAEIARLYGSEIPDMAVEEYFERIVSVDAEHFRWQRFNISRARAADIYYGMHN